MKLTRLGKWVFASIIILIPVLLYFNSTENERLKKVPMPTGLDKNVAEKADLLVSEAARKGIRVVITDEFRSADAQDRLFAKGRTEPGDVVTHARGGESYHNYGLAIDFAIASRDSGNLLWDMDYDGNGNSRSDWKEVVAIAKTLGFEWGGDWKQFKDYPHLQMTYGLTINDLQTGLRPSINGQPTQVSMRNKIYKFFRNIASI